MYEINLHVRENGTLDTGSTERLILGTQEEIQRARLIFEVDSSIEGTYHYIKLVNGNLSCLYRVNNKRITLNKTITSKEGVWLISFISTNQLVNNGKFNGSYVFITEPIEAVVVKGIISDGAKSEELDILDKLCGMTYQILRIPDGVSSIGPYFLYNTKKSFELEIGPSVTSVGSYAFYDSEITRLSFDEGSALTTLYESAFYKLALSCDVVIPKSVNNWGKYIFQNCTGGGKLSFEENSLLRTLGSYALWNNEFTEIELPDGLRTLSGNTYVIKNCERLRRLWIPNTIVDVIPANAIFGCPLEEIVLERDFNVSANFSNCITLTAESLVNMFYSLKNLTGQTSKSLTLGSTNLAKLTTAQKQIATNKNWTLS